MKIQFDTDGRIIVPEAVQKDLEKEREDKE